LAQPDNQVAVDFDDMQMTDTRQQRLGQRTKAGADFHHGFTSTRGNGIDYLPDDAGIHQKVLAEAFAGHMPRNTR
jgi:hypothetical protein